MLRKINQLWRSKFARSVAIVASGTAAAQVIGIAFSPIITRLYGPEAFGILGTYTALLAILTPLAALSYPIAIVLPKDDNEAKGLAKLSLKISLVTSGLTAFLLLIADERLVELLNLGDIGKFIWFVPLAMLLSVWLAVATQWVVRKKLFKLKAKVAVVNALLQNGLKSGIGVIAPFALVLITVATLGQALNAGLFYIGIRKDANRELINNNEPIKQVQLAKDYSDFAYYRTPQIVLNAASQSMPVLMLTVLFGPAAAGFYAIAAMTLKLPSSLIGGAVGNVFYPKVTEAFHRGQKLTGLVIKATLGLLIIGGLPFILVMAIGPWLYGIVFGQEWSVAGEYARWLALWSWFMFANTPAIQTLPILKAQGIHLVFTCVTIASRILALYLGYTIYQSAIAAVIAYALVSMVLNILIILLALFLCVRYDKKMSLRPQ